MTHTKKTSWPSQKQNRHSVSRPRLSESKRTTFRGAKWCCKSVWDALPLAKVAAKGQAWADTEMAFLQNNIKYLPVILERSDGKWTTFRGAKRRCKSEWNAIPDQLERCQPSGWRKGQVWADTEESFLQNGIKYLPVILERSEESGKRYRY